MNQALENENIICFGGEDWWYHHPHSKTHIMKRFALSNRVLFINSISMGLPSVTNPDFFLKIRRKLKSYLRWLRKAPEGLWVMTPLVLPFYASRVARALNATILPLQIRFAMWLCGMRKAPIIWVAMPTAADAVERLPCKLLVYQVADKYEANEDSALAAVIIRGLHERLKERASVVFYSSRKLFEEAVEPHRYFLEHAVDFDHFAKKSTKHIDELEGIPHPILGYFGGVDYVMDVELIAEVARRRPEWHWLMVGNRSNLVRFQEANIHFVGPKPYTGLPDYIRYFDVCVMPWNMNSMFVRYTSAIKVREYLATGKPVLIAPVYEFANAPGMRIYHSADEFIELVEDALHRDTDQDRRIRQDSVRNCTWDIRVAQVSDLILKLLDRQATGDRQVRFSAQTEAE